MSNAYLFDFERDDNGTYLATCPAFPEITTYVDEIGEIVLVGIGAIEEAIAARISRGEDIPDPATGADIQSAYRDDEAGTARAWVKLPHQTTLKVMLYRLLRSEGLTRAELARRLNWNRETVDRLFRLDHRSRVELIERALRELGQEISVTLEPIQSRLPVEA